MNKNQQDKAGSASPNSGEEPGQDGLVIPEDNSSAVESLRKGLEVTPATDLKYMSYASEAVLQQVPGLHRKLLWGICACVLVLVTWA